MGSQWQYWLRSNSEFFCNVHLPWMKKSYAISVLSDIQSKCFNANIYIVHNTWSCPHFHPPMGRGWGNVARTWCEYVTSCYSTGSHGLHQHVQSLANDAQYIDHRLAKVCPPKKCPFPYRGIIIMVFWAPWVHTPNDTLTHGTWSWLTCRTQTSLHCQQQAAPSTNAQCWDAAWNGGNVYKIISGGSFPTGQFVVGNLSCRKCLYDGMLVGGWSDPGQ